jgi:hypothetical protein
MNKETKAAEVENFINHNRKICWEAEFEDGEYCIGENKVRTFIQSRIAELEAEKESLKEYIMALKNSDFTGWNEDSISGYKTACTSILEHALKPKP